MTRVEIYRSVDLFGGDVFQNELIEIAADMLSTPEQIRSYVLDGPPNKRDFVNVTFVSDKKPVGGKDPLLKPGQVYEISKEGETLPTCDPAKKPFSSLRLGKELQGIYEKIDKLTQVLSIRRNCLAISEKDSVEVQVQDENKKFIGSGEFVFVKKIEWMLKEDLLKNSVRLKDLADGMQMEIQDVVDYINTSKFDDLNITTIQNTNSVTTPPPPGNNLKYIQLPKDEGKTLSSCSRPRSQLQIREIFQDELKTAFEAREARAMVDGGVRNCFQLGDEIPVAYRDSSTGNFKEIPGLKVKILSVAVREKASVLADPFFVSYLAEDMGLSGDKLQEFVNQRRFQNRKSLNITRFEFVGGGN